MAVQYTRVNYSTYRKLTPKVDTRVYFWPWVVKFVIRGNIPTGFSKIEVFNKFYPVKMRVSVGITRDDLKLKQIRKTVSRDITFITKKSELTSKYIGMST